MSLEIALSLVLLVWPLIGTAVIAVAIREPRYRGVHEHG